MKKWTWKSFIRLHCDNNLGSVLFLLGTRPWLFSANQIKCTQTFKHRVCLRPSLLALKPGSPSEILTLLVGTGAWVLVLFNTVVWMAALSTASDLVLHFPSRVPPRAALSDKCYRNPPLLCWCVYVYQIFMTVKLCIIIVYRCISLFYFIMK